MKTTKFILAALLLSCIPVAMAFAQQMPQDNWAVSELHVNGSFTVIAVGPDDNLYAATGGTVAVYNQNGMLIGLRGTNLNVCGIALDSSTNLYVLDANGTNMVRKYSPVGILISTFAPYGTNDNEVIPSAGRPCALTIGSNNQVYVADAGNARVQVYDKDGNHLFHWGESAGNAGGILGRFSLLRAVAALPNGDIVVRNLYGQFHEMQLFDSSGKPLAIAFIGQELANENRDPNMLVVTSDGLLALTRSRNDSGALIDFFHFFSGGSVGGGVLNSLSTISLRDLRPDKPQNPRPVCIAFDKAGKMHVGYDSNFDTGSIYSSHRYFTGDKFSTNAPPLPYILSAKQRANSSLVDINYRVNHQTKTNVSTGLIAFVDNLNDFWNLRIPHLFAEGTATNIGVNCPANVAQRVTWDASELVTNFLNLQFEVLAKDDRSLLPLSFATVPPSQSQTNFTMSRTAVVDSDLLSIWYWFLATGDSAIVLTNGEVRGVVGTYNGQTLASGTTTTSQGRAFLYERLNVRAPTAGEITRAQTGNYGFISVGANNVVKLP